MSHLLDLDSWSLSRELAGLGLDVGFVTAALDYYTGCFLLSRVKYFESLILSVFSESSAAWRLFVLASFAERRHPQSIEYRQRFAMTASSGVKQLSVTCGSTVNAPMAGTLHDPEIIIICCR